MTPQTPPRNRPSFIGREEELEQMMEPATTALENWLGATERAAFVITSRERLRLEGEVVIEVPPMSLEGGSSSEAVRLFVERATTTFPDFKPSEDELALIAEVASRLDGLPLAIELAAARASLLTPSQILDRLSHHRNQLTEADHRLEQAEKLISDPDNPVATVLTLHAAHIALMRDVSEPDHISKARSLLETFEASNGRTSTRSQHVELAARILERTLEQVSPPQGALVVSDDGALVAPPFMDAVPLTTRLPLRRLLLSLSRARLDRPGEPVSTDELISNGWPEEHIAARAAKNRLRVGLAALRQLGLKECLVHQNGGYMIAPSQSLVLIPAEAASKFNR